MTLSRGVSDTLILLIPGFEDPVFPGQQFYCSHCALLEGLLASFPALTSKLIVKRVAWPRPRHSVIEMLGASNQWLPLLLLGDESDPELTTREHEGRHFIADKDELLKALHLRHGFPVPHH